MDLVLFGMQGSGKGTQAKVIAETCGFTIFEAGAELRKLAQMDTPLAQKVKAIIEAGHLVPTEVVMEIIDEFVKHLPHDAKVLFDGIPRSDDQKIQFDEIMEKNGRSFKGLLIKLSPEEAVKRLTTRRICSVCKSTFPAFYEKARCENCGGALITRQDDTPDAIQVRLDTFQSKTVPVIEAYEAAGKLLTVDGLQSIDAVSHDIMKLLKENELCQ